MMVLNAICDDYEDIGQIKTLVGRDAGHCGMKIEWPEIETALRELVRGGLARAYKLYPSSRPPHIHGGMPPAREMVEHGAYFSVTAEGMKLHLAEFEGWPFDEENNLRKDWTPPES
jgi:hypothetical protein